MEKRDARVFFDSCLYWVEMQSSSSRGHTLSRSLLFHMTVAAASSKSHFSSCLLKLSKMVMAIHGHKV